MRWLSVLLVASCASGRSEPATIDAALDAPTADAAMAIDAPVTTSTCTQPFSGVLATWSFTGESGTQTATQVTSKAPGVVAGAITRSAGLTAVSGTGSINSSNWATSATRDLTKYYTFTIAPPAGCMLSLASAGVDARASGTGPVMAAIATSADNYAAATTLSTAAASSPAVTVTGAASTIELRVYGYAASATGGTLRLQTSVTLTGSLQ